MDSDKGAGDEVVPLPAAPHFMPLAATQSCDLAKKPSSTASDSGGSSNRKTSVTARTYNQKVSSTPHNNGSGSRNPSVTIPTHNQTPSSTPGNNESSSRKSSVTTPTHNQTPSSNPDNNDSSCRISSVTTPTHNWTPSSTSGNNESAGKKGSIAELNKMPSPFKNTDLVYLFFTNTCCRKVVMKNHFAVIS